MSFTIPDFVDYPELYNVSDNLKLFKGVFVYVIEPYPVKGYSLYIGFREDYSFFRIADFKSKEIGKDDLDQQSQTVLAWSALLKEVMKSARVTDALFYFSAGKDLRLVDVMMSANKFLGPGMLKDLFASVVPTQEVITHVVLDDEEISKYKGKIVKPSRFRYLTEEGLVRPQYGII